jgi:signal transduction histidine kinase
MRNEWSVHVLLAAELTFAVLFVRALRGYLHRRDPLQRDVLLVFLPCTLVFCVDVVRRLSGGLPTWIGIIATTVLLAQPYLTVRLAGRLRAVPRWLDRTMLLAYLAIALPIVIAPRPLTFTHLSAMVIAYFTSEIAAAGLLFDKARRRAGANRARLMTAAGATFTFGLVIVFIGLGAMPGANPVLPAISRVLALASGLGYLVAFMPPRALRRMFAATAAQEITERLLRARADSPEQVWQTYAEIMRAQTGADAVTVLLPHADGVLARTAYAGPPVPTPAELTASDLTALIRAGRPARLREGDPSLVEHYGDDLGEDFVTVLSMPVPPDVEGAVLLFNRHRTLFSDDDLRLLAALGGQAGILAERQAVARELSTSVEALTRASQAKTSFLANMSHELRTPLNAIIGFSDLMRMEEPDGDRRRVPAEWVEHIHTSGRHLLGLINDILDLAKVEAGRLDLRLAPLRVDTAVQELLTGLSPLFSTNRLTVVTDLPPVVAQADRVRFRQIVENLLSNAIKFTPEGGTITVTAGVTTGDAAGAGSQGEAPSVPSPLAAPSPHPAPNSGPSLPASPDTAPAPLATAARAGESPPPLATAARAGESPPHASPPLPHTAPSPPATPTSLETPPSSAAFKPDISEIYLAVSDTGVGISAADQERVFEEFQQVGDPERQRAGTGLGLALTKRLVEAHGGEITLVSELGRGSTFTVRFPAALDSPEQQRAEGLRAGSTDANAAGPQLTTPTTGSSAAVASAATPSSGAAAPAASGAFRKDAS